MRKNILALPLFVLCLVIAGCGTKFVYNNLDWFAIDYIEDFVDLESEQKQILSQRIVLLSRWHQNEELPLYISHIDQLKAVNPQAVDLAFLAKQEAQFKQHSDRLLKQAAPDIYALTRQLTDDQVSEFIESLEKRHTKYREKYQELDDKEIRQVYAERLAENIENWVGRLSDSQAAMIDEWSQEVNVTAFDWIEHQVKMKVEIQSLLEHRNDLNLFQPKFNQLLFEPRSYFSPQLLEKSTQNRAIANRNLVAIINSMSQKQTAYFRDELQDWKDIALDLKIK